MLLENLHQTKQQLTAQFDYSDDLLRRPRPISAHGNRVNGQLTAGHLHLKWSCGALHHCFLPWASNQEKYRMSRKKMYSRTQLVRAKARENAQIKTHKSKVKANNSSLQDSTCSQAHSSKVQSLYFWLADHLRRWQRLHQRLLCGRTLRLWGGRLTSNARQKYDGYHTVDKFWAK